MIGSVRRRLRRSPSLSRNARVRARNWLCAVLRSSSETSIPSLATVPRLVFTLSSILSCSFLAEFESWRWNGRNSLTTGADILRPPRCLISALGSSLDRKIAALSAAGNASPTLSIGGHMVASSSNGRLCFILCRSRLQAFRFSSGKLSTSGISLANLSSKLLLLRMTLFLARDTLISSRSVLMTRLWILPTSSFALRSFLQSMIKPLSSPVPLGSGSWDSCIWLTSWWSPSSK